VLQLLDEFGSPAAVDSTHGRYFGFVIGGTDPAATGAAALTAAWDQNVGSPVMSPVGTHLDAIAARWVCELLGLPGDATASFCAGATVANLTCVLAARDALLHRAGWDTLRQGLAGAPALRVVATAEVHVSALKALHMAGIGTDAVTRVPTDEAGRIRADAFPEVDERTLVLLQAGNVNTGQSDPFADIIPRARAAGAWVHVDGAFGLWAAVSDRRRHLVAGAEQADSWATDAHKWLNAPYDSAIAICAREEDLRRSFATEAAYLRGDSGRVLMHLGVQMSQRARGVEAWAIIASRGRRAHPRPRRPQSGARPVRGRCQHGCGHRGGPARRNMLGGRHYLAGQACNAAVGLGRCDDTRGHRRERACNPSLLERSQEQALIHTHQPIHIPEREHPKWLPTIPSSSSVKARC
jgi:glutamate/tyrosine decarboxylase-like PLP-dependent enzyme